MRVEADTINKINKTMYILYLCIDIIYICILYYLRTFICAIFRIFPLEAHNIEYGHSKLKVLELSTFQNFLIGPYKFSENISIKKHKNTLTAYLCYLNATFLLTYKNVVILLYLNISLVFIYMSRNDKS